MGTVGSFFFSLVELEKVSSSRHGFEVTRVNMIHQRNPCLTPSANEKMVGKYDYVETCKT